LEEEPLNRVEQPAMPAQSTRKFNNLDRLLNWSDSFVGRRRNGEDLGGHVCPASFPASVPGGVDMEVSRSGEMYQMGIIRRAPES
jgi:hypothetical protein